MEYKRYDSSGKIPGAVRGELTGIIRIATDRRN
jgi:hypothetical protein